MCFDSPSTLSSRQVVFFLHSTALGGKKEYPDKSGVSEDGLTGTGGG